MKPAIRRLVHLRKFFFHLIHVAKKSGGIICSFQRIIIEMHPHAKAQISHIVRLTIGQLCTELVFRGAPDETVIRESIAKDLAVRYPEGGAPEVNTKALIKEIRKIISEP